MRNTTNETLRLMKLTEEIGSFDKSPYQKQKSRENAGSVIHLGLKSPYVSMH
jgi:hypothetical protein